MRASRPFRPSAPVVLEGRVVPSAMHASLSEAEIAQSNASDTQFPLDTTATIPQVSRSPSS